MNKLRETSRDYANPYRPKVLGLYNAIGGAAHKFGFFHPLNAESIIKTAAQKAGLQKNHRGYDDSYMEGLRILVKSIESEALLNPMGRAITRRRLTGVLSARFKAEKMLQAKPEILTEQLVPPIVITGLQRTGTTLLHRLLAADRRIRSLRAWEVINPVPPDPKSSTDPRIKQAHMAEKGAAWMAPDFFAVHPIDHRAPEEDVLLLDTTFRSTVAEAILRVPSYANWLENIDSTPAYEFMRKLLLLLQATDNRQFWVLKTPHHLEFLDVLLAVFPEAKVIQTHRDPSKTIGSYLSMVAHAYGMFTDSPNPLEIGKHWSRKCKRMVDKGMQYRRQLKKSIENKTFTDLHFVDLITDPIAALKCIYEFIGLDFDSIAEQDACNLLDNHKRYRFGKHIYDLADFGLTVQSVRQDMGEYIDYFNIPNEA